MSILLKIRSKLFFWISYLSHLPLINDYRSHNRSIFTHSKYSPKSPVVLMELNDMHSSHIAYAYLGNILAQKHGGQIKAHAQASFTNLRQRLKFKLKSFLGLAEFGVYKSFGVREFVELRTNKIQRARARIIYEDVITRLHNNRELEDLHLNGVWVGDLFYDSFLMTHKLPTIDISSAVFRQFLLKSIELFVFWEDYFSKNDVRAVNVSHCVYNLAIPLRIAVLQDIEAYQASLTSIYRPSTNNLFAYGKDFSNFREKFSTLPLDIQEQGISLAKLRIKRRFEGEIGVDMIYSTKSAYGTPRHNRLLRVSKRKKILIATHCFYDSPHSFGKNIFPDFYEWIEFLGELSELTDYDWYIKTHPDYLPGTKNVIDNFVLRFPKFTLLPCDSSHHQIISEGIDVALTCYGTIGFEYAALGVMVINASLNNQHIAYNFNLHARDVMHYRELLINLDSLELNIDSREIYEYYFMRYIFNTNDLFFKNYDHLISEIGDYYMQFTPLIYEKWLAEWSDERHIEISRALNDFIISKDYRMSSINNLVGTAT